MKNRPKKAAKRVTKQAVVEKLNRQAEGLKDLPLSVQRDARFTMAYSLTPAELEALLT